LLLKLKQQTADIKCLSFSPDAVEMLRLRLEERLTRATPEDRRFIFESIGLKVIAHPDRIWDIDIELPRQEQSDLQIVNNIPGSVYT
jgi:hypothetical protein